nr:MAG TPA_asm: hypothetical protein [Caudoviricetes sp.]
MSEPPKRLCLTALRNLLRILAAMGQEFFFTKQAVECSFCESAPF